MWLTGSFIAALTGAAFIGVSLNMSLESLAIAYGFALAVGGLGSRTSWAVALRQARKAKHGC
jgi:hypothetical protein